MPRNAMNLRHRRFVARAAFDAEINKIINKRSWEQALTDNRGGSIDPVKVLGRREFLARQGFFDLLAQHGSVPVVLPGNLMGVATGVNKEGAVVVKGWDLPFVPEVVKIKK